MPFEVDAGAADGAGGAALDGAVEEEAALGKAAEGFEDDNGGIGGEVAVGAGGEGVGLGGFNDDGAVLPLAEDDDRLARGERDGCAGGGEEGDAADAQGGAVGDDGAGELDRVGRRRVDAGGGDGAVGAAEAADGDPGADWGLLAEGGRG